MFTFLDANNQADYHSCTHIHELSKVNSLALLPLTAQLGATITQPTGSSSVKELTAMAWICPAVVRPHFWLSKSDQNEQRKITDSEIQHKSNRSISDWRVNLIKEAFHTKYKTGVRPSRDRTEDKELLEFSRGSYFGLDFTPLEGSNIILKWWSLKRNLILWGQSQTFFTGIWKRICFIASSPYLHHIPYFSCRSTQKLTPISKRTSGYSINKTFAQLFFLSDFPDSHSSFITWSPPPLVLWFIQAPMWAANSLGILLLNHCDFHQMIRNTKQSWLMLLCSQILISRWFVLPSSLVCKDRGEAASSLLCAWSQIRN